MSYLCMCCLKVMWFPESLQRWCDSLESLGLLFTPRWLNPNRYMCRGSSVPIPCSEEPYKGWLQFSAAQASSNAVPCLLCLWA